MSKKDRYWIDCLNEKHECWSYDNAAAVEVRHGDRLLRVLMPIYLKGVQAQVTAESAPFVFLLGKQSRNWDGSPLGVVIVAKQREADTYEAVVWHELYPYALVRCGLTEAKPRADS
jgi:hypothetical protein